MVQIQSSQFPLYDRNPQTFVPNIFFAKPADYVTATQRIYHAQGALELHRTAGGSASLIRRSWTHGGITFRRAESRGRRCR